MSVLFVDVSVTPSVLLRGVLRSSVADADADAEDALIERLKDGNRRNKAAIV